MKTDSHSWPFGRMHGGQNQVVLVKEGIAGEVTGGTRRVQRQFGEKSFSSRIAAGNLLQLLEVGFARIQTVVQAFQLRLVPASHQRDLRLPATIVELRARQLLQQRAKCRPVFGSRGSEVEIRAAMKTESPRRRGARNNATRSPAPCRATVSAREKRRPRSLDFQPTSERTTGL